MFVEFVLPQRCVVCRGGRVQLCQRCRETLPRLTGPLCDHCGTPTAWPVRRCCECASRRIAFATARAAVVYDERVRLFVSAWKERGLRRLARAAAEITVAVLPPPRDPLTFVPADPDRGLQRGHHPAAALARELAEFWGADCLDLLARRVGRRQRGLPLAVRRANVRGAFRARAPSPRRIVLVDDVYTSGSTVNAAAGALKKAGARRVEVVTFARAVRGYYSETILTDAQGGRFATSDEGQERRGH